MGLGERCETRWKARALELRQLLLKQRISDRIMLATLWLTLGLITVLGTLGYLALRKSEVNHTQALMENVVLRARYEIERTITTIEDTISGAAGQTLVANSLADVRNPDDLIHPFLRDAIKPHDAIKAIALINFRGEVLSIAGSGFSPSLSMPDTARSIIASRQATAFFLQTGNGARMILAYPVTFLPTNTVEGAIVAEVDSKRLLPASTNEDTFPYSLELFSSGGLRIASRSRIDGNEPFFMEESAIRPARSDYAQPGLRVALKTPRSAALAPLRKLQQVFLVLALAAIVTAIFFSRRMAAHIAGPVVALRDAARIASERGHAAIQNVQVFGQGELRELADTFNEMGRSLAEAHAELEARVEARTRELRLAREQIKEIFDSVAEVVYSSSPDLNTIHFVSAAAEKIFGVAPARFTREPALWLSLIHPDDRPRALESHAMGAENSGGVVEYRIVRPDGEIRWVRDHFTLLRNPETARVLRISGTATDITAAVLANEARLRAEEALRTLHRAIHASSAGVVITDVKHSKNRVLMINPAFERITGYQQQEVLGREFPFLLGEDTSEKESSKLEAAIREKRECRLILKNYRKDGTPFWNELAISPVEDTTGQISQFVGILNDITPLVESQKQIMQWAQHVDTIFTLSPDGFISLDRAGEVSYVNPAFERMTGMNASALVGMSARVLDKRIRELADPVHPYPSLELQTDEEVPPADHVIFLKRPAPIVLKRIVRRAQAEKAHTIIYFREVTREMEVDRMKSEFLTTAAHELRTPMASVMGFAELLLNREFPRDTQKEYLDIIHRQAKRLTSLLNDLLDLARIEAQRRGALTISRHRLDDIVRDAVGSLMVPGDRRKVRVQISQPLPEVEVDAAKIQQALTNLLGNAYKYSPQGGEIRLESSERMRGGEKQVGLTITDHGIGMTPAQQARAFERFFRADNTGAIPGTGLGLALVKEIMETHGGEVELTSAFGVGTQASLWLPLPQQETPEMIHSQDT